MAIAFAETMRGWLRAPEGEQPISFELRASGGAGGRFALAGRLSFPPFALDAPARGELAISPRRLAYALAFAGDDGRRYRLLAEKRPSLLAPVRSMTSMWAVVRELDGPAVAEGEMRFDLRDLPAFLASWLPRFGR